MSDSGYINGLVTMATVTSRGGSYSYARAMRFSRKKWKAQFSEICGIPEEQLEFEKTGESAKDAFRWAFVEEDKRLEEDLFRLMRISLGDEEAVLRPVRPEAFCVHSALGSAGYFPSCSTVLSIPAIISVLMAFSTQRIMTPTSAKMANHMLAMPIAPRIRHRTLMKMAKTMFS